jgi:5-methylcytosine-specific restriction enzyme subunit McrC
VDVVHNRILKAVLGVLARSPDIEAGLFGELRDLRARLAAVTDAPLSRHLFTQLQLSRNTGHYGLLMKICEMVLELAMPQEGGQGSRFADILQDEKRMSAIFEAFVRNFYRREQEVFSVASELIAWNIGLESPGYVHYLPSMLTDVTLRSPDRTIVVDAKFYREALVSRHGGQDKVRSDHLYQILAYLRNLAPRKGPYERAEGLLLYPRTGDSELRLDFRLVGHRVRACTVDLTRRWTDIHQEMLALLAS